jgi:hypothetical protein
MLSWGVPLEGSEFDLDALVACDWADADVERRTKSDWVLTSATFEHLVDAHAVLQARCHAVYGGCSNVHHSCQPSERAA